MDPYHFINFPKDANDYNQERNCRLRNCIIEAIAWYLQVLRSPDVPRNEKRVALRFVAHLVGDIHQPFMPGSPRTAVATVLMLASTAER
jgi:hypothetical protein